MRFRSFRRHLFCVALVLGACTGDQPIPVKRLGSEPTAPVAVATPDAGPSVEIVAVVPGPAPALPPDVQMDLPGTFAERMRLGRTLVGMRKPAEAMIAFQGAAELDPESAHPAIEIARVRLAQTDLAGAREAGEEAVKLAPESSLAWNTLGRVALGENKLDDAAAHFEKAIEANDANVYAWNNLGLTRMRQGRWDDAAQALEEAVTGEDAAPFMWNNLGAAYEGQHDFDEARSAYEKGAEGGSALAAANLARLDEAIEHSAKADGEGATEDSF